MGKIKNYLYRKAFRFVMDQHTEWLRSQGKEGKMLDFQGMYLKDVSFQDCTMVLCDFRRTKFDRVFAQQSVWKECDVRSASIYLTAFDSSNIQQCNFHGAIMRKVKGIKFMESNNDGNKPTSINSDVHSNRQADAAEMDSQPN